MASPFLTAQWKYLVMLSYEIEPQALAGLIPRETELDDWGGKTYVSMVGFLFLNTKVKGILIPLHRNFEEVNLRFYVRVKGENGWVRGVVFVREIVPLPAVALVANRVYGENYVSLPMRHQVKNMGETLQLSYNWRFRGDWNVLSATVGGEPKPIEEGSHEEFITEHYWGYTRQRDGSTVGYRVEHPRWKVWQAQTCQLTCDARALYGAPFADSLSQPPVSAFVADGSETRVMEARKISDF